MAAPVPARAWKAVFDPLIRRTTSLTFGIIGQGRIGTAAALRAKALGYRVIFFDPYRPNGAELAIGVERALTLDDLLRQTDTLSIHAPLTPDTNRMIGARELALLPKGAVVINTARGPIIDIDALASALKSGHLSGVGLDVVPIEPPPDPFPELIRAYRAREAWTEGRLHHHAALGVPYAGGLGRYPDQGRGDDAGVHPRRGTNVIAPEDFSPRAARNARRPLWAAGIPPPRISRCCGAAPRPSPTRPVPSTAIAIGSGTFDGDGPPPPMVQPPPQPSRQTPLNSSSSKVPVVGSVIA